MKSRLHRHHVLPIRLGGTESAQNIVKISVRQHAEAHLELYLQYGDPDDLKAYKSLLVQDEFYEQHQEARRKYMTGRIVSPDTCQKISDAKQGIIPWGATNAAAKANKGRKFSAERRDKISGANNHNYASGKCNIPMERRLAGFAKAAPEQRSNRAKGKLWWTNGAIDVRVVEQPEGFTRGRSQYGTSK